MRELPNELVLEILRLAAQFSKDAAINLCLLSAETSHILRPILYRKVVLVNDRQIIAFSWTLRNTSRFQGTRILWILNLEGQLRYYPGVELIPTKCARLEELASFGAWLENGSYRIQARELKRCLYLRRICFIDRDHVQIQVPALTHLHIINPRVYEGRITTILSNTTSLQNLKFLYLKVQNPFSIITRLNPSILRDLLRILPCIESVVVNFDAEAPNEIASFLSPFRELCSVEPRVALQVNKKRKGIPSDMVFGATRARMLLAIEETSDRWCFSTEQGFQA